MKLLVRLLAAIWIPVAVACPFPGLAPDASAKVGSSQLTLHNPRQSFWPGEVVEYRCNSGWKIPDSENASITCRDDATWTWPAPRCDVIVDDLLTGKPHRRDLIGKLQERKWSRSKCDSYTYTFLRFIPAPQARQLFQAGLRISDVHVDFCPEGRQSAVVALQSASSRILCKPTSREGSTETFACHGAVLETTSESFLEIGLGSLCRVRDVRISARAQNQCGIPPAPVYGRVDPTTNSTARFQCISGFWLFGNAAATCDPLTGIWLPLPTCVPYKNLLLIGTFAGIATFVLLAVAIAIWRRKLLFKRANPSANQRRLQQVVELTASTESSDLPALTENIYEDLPEFAASVRQTVHPAPRPPLEPLETLTCDFACF